MQDSVILLYHGYELSSSRLFVGMLGNSVAGPRAISFLFLHPLVSSTLTDISYPNLDQAPLPVSRVDPDLQPIIQNALLTDQPGITQSYTVGTLIFTT